MHLMDKVGHTVLKKGDVVRSPSGSNEWVVIDNGEKVVIACISKMMHKESEDLEEWYKVK
jgi:ribosomal silencing factor RsfS